MDKSVDNFQQQNENQNSKSKQLSCCTSSISRTISENSQEPESPDRTASEGETDINKLQKDILKQEAMKVQSMPEPLAQVLCSPLARHKSSLLSNNLPKF